MKESSDPVHFQTQAQAQSCCFSQPTAVLFDVTSSVLSEQAPLPTTALHQVLTAQPWQQLLCPSLQLLLLAFPQPPCPSRSLRVARLCRGGSAPLPPHQPMPCSAASPCSHRELLGAPAQGWCLTSHLCGLLLNWSEVMLQNLYFSNPPICLRNS